MAYENGVSLFRIVIMRGGIAGETARRREGRGREAVAERLNLTPKQVIENALSHFLRGLPYMTSTEFWNFF